MICGVKAKCFKVILREAVKIKATKGFSVLEVMIVLAILAVAATMAAPSFNKYRHNTNLREAARDLVSDINQMKQRAVAESIHYRIVFDQAANTYKFQIEQPLDSGLYVDLIPLAANTKSPASIGANITISNPSFSFGFPLITFEPRGTTGAGSVTLSNKVLSTAKITTTLMGKVYVTYSML
jgi:prepilin-type N-terminal cleavage/methylation domain-containing protein